MQSSAETNAAVTWSQIMYSIVSDNPPPNMTRAYYYARPLPIRIIQAQLKYGLETYGLWSENAKPRHGYDGPRPLVHRSIHHQEMRNIKDRKEFTKYSEKLRANKERYQQWTEHIKYFMRITEEEAPVHAKERYSDKLIDHISYLTWRIDKVMLSSLDDEMVQVSDIDKYQQGKEHIQSATRSRVVDDEVVQGNEDKYQQGIEHIQSATRSRAVDDKVVQGNEDKYQQGIEHIQSATRSRAVDDEVVQGNEDKYQQGIEHIQSAMRSRAVDDEVVKGNEDKYQQGIEHIQSATRSRAVDGEVVQENEDKYQQGIEHIQSLKRSNVSIKLVKENEDKKQRELEDYRFRYQNSTTDHWSQENKDKYQQRIEQIRSSLGYNADEEVVRTCEAENLDEIEHEKRVLLRLVTFLEFVEDRIWEEHQSLRSEVLEAYELMHQNGIADNIQSQMEGKDPKVQYQEKRLELISRICDQEVCLRIQYGRQQKVGKDVYCKHCEMLRTNEDGNQIGIKQTKEISNLFDNLLELLETRDMHGEEEPAMQVKVLKLIKIMHHYRVETIRKAAEKELEDVKQMYSDTAQDPSTQYMKKGLEVMLRICGNDSYEKTITEIASQAEWDNDLCDEAIAGARFQVIYKW